MYTPYGGDSTAISIAGDHRFTFHRVSKLSAKLPSPRLRTSSGKDACLTSFKTQEVFAVDLLLQLISRSVNIPPKGPNRRYGSTLPLFYGICPLYCVPGSSPVSVSLPHPYSSRNPLGSSGILCVIQSCSFGSLDRYSPGFRIVPSVSKARRDETTLVNRDSGRV